jgi:hypothetical protein
MCNNENIGIIREQGEFFDVKPLTEEEKEIIKKQKENESK